LPFFHSPTQFFHLPAVLTTGPKDEAGNPLDQNTTNTGLQQKRWVFFTV
jgi:hypothetical protein